MKKEDEKTYTHNGKTIKIIPAKRVKKTAEGKSTEEGGSVKSGPVKKTEKGVAKFAVGDKVTVKNVPTQYSGAGFVESVITKVFKSTYDQQFHYTVRSASGQELPLVKEDQIKPRKINFKK